MIFRGPPGVRKLVAWRLRCPKRKMLTVSSIFVTAAHESQFMRGHFLWNDSMLNLTRWKDVLRFYLFSGGGLWSSRGWMLLNWSSSSRGPSPTPVNTSLARLSLSLGAWNAPESKIPWGSSIFVSTTHLSICMRPMHNKMMLCQFGPDWINLSILWTVFKQSQLFQTLTDSVNK